MSACAAAHRCRSLSWARQSSGWPPSAQRHGRFSTSQAACAAVGHCVAASMLCRLYSIWHRPCFQAQRCSASSMEHQSLLRCCTAGGLEAPDPNNTRPKLRSKPPVTQDAPAGTGSLPAAAPTERGRQTPASQPLQQRCSAGDSSRPPSGAVPAQGGAQSVASQTLPRSQRRSSAGTAAVPAGGLGEQGTEAPEEQGAQGSERRSRAGAAAVHTARPPQSSERRAQWACTSAGPARHLLPATESLPALQCIASSSGTWCAAYKFIQQQGLASAPRQVSRLWVGTWGGNSQLTPGTVSVANIVTHSLSDPAICKLLPRQEFKAPLLCCTAGARVPAGGPLQAVKTRSGTCNRVLAKLGLPGGSMGGSSRAATAEPPAASGRPRPSAWACSHDSFTCPFPRLGLPSGGSRTCCLL